MTAVMKTAFIGIDHPHGAGWRRTLEHLDDAIALSALVPRYGGTTASLEERLAGLPRYETVEQLIGEADFEAAVVCLPNDETPAAVIALAEAGKHVLVEKPAAATSEDARRMAAAVQQADVAFQTGFTWRYEEAANRLRQMVEDGRFGKLISVQQSFVTSDVARRGPDHYVFDKQVSGAGFFNWLACHWLDLIPYVTQEAIVSVTARVGRFGHVPIDVEDGGTAIMELEGGALVTFTGGYWIPRWSGESHWTLHGSQRWVHWDPTRPETGGVLEIHGPKPQWYAMEETFAVPQDKTAGYGGAPAVALLRDWVSAARSPGQRCRNTPESTVATLELIDAIYESSNSGRRVDCRIEAV